MRTDTVLYWKESHSLSISLEGLSEDLLEEIDEEEVRFVAASESQDVIFADDLTVTDSSITLDTVEPLTTQVQSVIWSIRDKATKKYFTGGKILVLYAPVEPDPEDPEDPEEPEEPE
jgi:hypothetical protein